MGYNNRIFPDNQQYIDNSEEDTDDDYSSDEPESVESLEFYSDKLDTAFEILESEHIICRQNWTCCRSCGLNDIEYELTPESKGFTFFHIQDAMFVDKNGLYLTYDSVGTKNETEEIGQENQRLIGQDIVKILRSVGLTTEWNGSIKTRIKVTGF
ncbi:Hypothetical protein HVR_LOCUS35 [uncultured virus]|nr:Hypothetical protein HVR_LOCUS35 [uncultured virus]